MPDSSQPRESVQVTQSFMPPVEDYMGYVRDIFATRHLTNHGKYEQKLQRELAAYLRVPALELYSNGTLGLQLAIRLLGLNGKTVITTPFTYVATVSALLWEGCRVLLADIDSRSLCIDPMAVRRRIESEPDVAGILPVHVYGNACDVEAIGEIAAHYKVKCFYDAAHAIGSFLDGQSLFAFGDAAVGSFHATKLFHTIEGGCIAAPPERMRKLRLLGAFGHCGDSHECLGINAKLSEFHAAMGLCVLPHLPKIIGRRAAIGAIYDSLLDTRKGLRRPVLHPGLKWNHAYYPVIFPDNAALMHVMAVLTAKNIHPRRYFYPALSRLPYLPGQSCPIAEDIAERVLCLPLWAEMPDDLAEQIAALVNKAM